MIPCDHMVGVNLNRKTDPYHSHVIYSDDHGQRWQIGGSTQNGTNECAVVETVDGLLYLNSRNYVGEKRRVGSWSYDQGDSFQEGAWEENLIEPVCQASLIRYTDKISYHRNRILFSNPASMNRERMTIRISYDECRRFYTQDQQLILTFVWIRNSRYVVCTNEEKAILTKQFHLINLI